MNTPSRILALAAVLCCVGFPIIDAAPDRPNIIVFMFDDLGYSDIGAYGGEARTPHMDRLAGEGVRFRSFYNTSRCSPTRMAFLTGAYYHRVAENPSHSLPRMRTDNNRTIAEILRDSGYGTYMVGKWHLGFSAEHAPAARGFEHVLGHGTRAGRVGQGSYWDPSTLTLVSEGDAIPERSYSSVPGEYYQKDAFRDYALDFIRYHRTRSEDMPFFMYVPFNVPHFYIDAPKEMIETAPPGEPTYLEIYADGWQEARSRRYERMVDLGVIPPEAVFADSFVPYPRANNPDAVPEWDSLSEARKQDQVRRMALYAAMIEKGDEVIGHIVNELEQAGELDNTLILIFSDNGGNAEGGIYGWARTGDMEDRQPNHPPLTGEDLAEMGQAGRNHLLSIGGGWAEVTNTPFRYFKRFSHEGGIRSPLIVHWPDGVVRPDRWTNHDGHVIDIAATILDITGISHPATDPGYSPFAQMDGVSLLPVFRDEPFPQRVLGFEHEMTRAWIDGDWKLVTKNFSAPDGDADTIELYHRPSDPTELTNLAEQHPRRVADMVRAWRAWATNVNVPESHMMDLPQLPPPADSGEELILDTFNRFDTSDIDTFPIGISGSILSELGPGRIWTQSHNAAGIAIHDNRLRILNAAGSSQLAIEYNFTGPEVLNHSGFSIVLDILEMQSTGGTTPPEDQFAGFGVGLSEQEAYAGGGLSSGNSFRGVAAVGNGRADFFVELDISGNLRVWVHGTPLRTIAVGRNYGRLQADFLVTGFAAGEEVFVEVYLDGIRMDLSPDDGSGDGIVFSWRKSDSNYIGLAASLDGVVDLDNFAVIAGRAGRFAAERFVGLTGRSDRRDYWLPMDNWGHAYTAYFPWVLGAGRHWFFLDGGEWSDWTWFFDPLDEIWYASRKGVSPWRYLPEVGWDRFLN